MKCPKCQGTISSAEDQVLETRNRADNMSIRRRRYCGACKHKFTTREYTIQDLADTLSLKKSILSNEFVDKVQFALVDIQCVTANLMELETMLKEQVVEARLIDQHDDKKASRHAAL